MERIDRLQDAVESMRADITVNFGRANFVQRFANNLRMDLVAVAGAVERGRGETLGLSEVVSGVERQVRRLNTLVQAMRDEKADAALRGG